ncbi:hypothetical protein DBR43_10415 [Pedobacter sp. KBW06]|uniref:hypothetical protein n=1 Tax=Pedobacter sp. KBW06 TaxID=2153359 RepID=UPI000F596072|nr:hypothetical protein [Pedobacter sp. KBW06]RQO71656.1 hypothetical protein DBR43_10415 [Pedobacter sp. KBW06]
MKKASSLYLRISIIGLFCLLQLLTVVSCKKNDLPQPITQGELEDWYSKNRSVNDVYFKDMMPLWDSIYINDQTDQWVYELNLSNPKNVHQTLGSVKYNSNSKNNIRLLIFKNKTTGKITTGCYMSVLNEEPELQNLKDIHYKHAENLSGKVMFFNMRGKLENGWEYIKGSIVKRINGSLEGYNYGTRIYYSHLKNVGNTRRLGNSNTLMIYQDPPCISMQPDYKTSCVGVEGYMECTTYVSGYSCMVYAPGAGSGGGGGGDGDGGGYTPYPGGGGSGTIDPDPIIPVWDIIDSLVNYPCAQDLLAQMPYLKNDIAEKINSTFNGNCDFHIKFVSSPFSSTPNIDGDHQVTNLVMKNGYNWDAGFSMESRIRINEEVLNHATKEYILVTMYHEALHAYLNVEKSRLGDQFTTVYPEINPAYANSLTGGIDVTKAVFVNQHTVMGNNFVKELSAAICSFNTKLPKITADALASSGILAMGADAKLLNQNERDVRKNKFTGSKCP